MTTRKRNVLMAFSLLFILALWSICSVDTKSLHMDGNGVHQLGGFFGFVVACLIGFVALFFALSLTGIVLVMVSMIVVIVIAAVLGSIVIALLPLILPVLFLMGIIALLTRRKSSS